MEKVWEIAPQSSVERHTITLWWHDAERGLCSQLIDGNTFPLRVCRTFLWLNAQRKEA